jgi:hypothetical protein
MNYRRAYMTYEVYCIGNNKHGDGGNAKIVNFLVVEHSGYTEETSVRLNVILTHLLLPVHNSFSLSRGTKRF